MKNKFSKRDVVWLSIIFLVIISALLGVILNNKSGAFDIVSGAATVASIVLSIVAVIYTMIDGQRDEQVKEETISKLNELKQETEGLIKKTEELKQKIDEINALKGKLNGAIYKANSSKSDSDTQEALEYLNKIQDILDQDFEE